MCCQKWVISMNKLGTIFAAALLALMVGAQDYSKDDYAKDAYDQSQYNTYDPSQYTNDYAKDAYAKDQAAKDQSVNEYIPPPEQRVCTEGITTCAKGEWLICSNNDWRVAQRCGANDRCDARAGCVPLPRIETQVVLPPTNISERLPGVSRFSCGPIIYPRDQDYIRPELPSDIPFNASSTDCILINRSESINLYLRSVEGHIANCRERNRVDFERAHRFMSNLSAQIPRIFFPPQTGSGFSEPCLGSLISVTLPMVRVYHPNYSEWPGREFNKRLGAINYNLGACNYGVSLTSGAYHACLSVDSLLECSVNDPRFSEYLADVSRSIQESHDAYETAYIDLELDVREFREIFNESALRVRCESFEQLRTPVFSRLWSFVRNLFGFG